MTAYQLQVVQLDEITNVAVTCPCGMTVSIPPGNLASAAVPQRCGCGKQFDDNVIKALAGLRQALTEFGKSGFTVALHLKTTT